MELIFGKLFHDTRKSKGLTLESIALKIGVTKAHLSLVENAKRNLSEDQARKAGEILEVDDMTTWIFLATKVSVIQTIQVKYPTQFNSLFRERKTKSKLFSNIVKAGLKEDDE